MRSGEQYLCSQQECGREGKPRKIPGSESLHYTFALKDMSDVGVETMFGKGSAQGFAPENIACGHPTYVFGYPGLPGELLQAFKQY